MDETRCIEKLQQNLFFNVLFEMEGKIYQELGKYFFDVCVLWTRDEKYAVMTLYTEILCLFQLNQPYSICLQYVL